MHCETKRGGPFELCGHLLLRMLSAASFVATEMKRVSLRILRWRHSPRSSCISTHGDGRAFHSTFELVSECLSAQPKYGLNSSAPPRQYSTQLPRVRRITFAFVSAPMYLSRWAHEPKCLGKRWPVSESNLSCSRRRSM